MIWQEYLQLRLNYIHNIYALFNIYTNIRVNKDISVAEINTILNSTFNNSIIINNILRFLDNYYNVIHAINPNTEAILCSYINESQTKNNEQYIRNTNE